MPSCKPRNAHQSILRHGQPACSSTTSASHISLRPYRRAISARSCRIRTLYREEGLPTSDSKNPRLGEALRMSGNRTTGQRLHVQRTLNAHPAASASIVSRTVSQVRVVKCLFPCDLRHRPRMDRIRDHSREGRDRTADCHLHRGECIVTCSSGTLRSTLISVLRHHYFDLILHGCANCAGHFGGHLCMYGMYTPNSGIRGGRRWKTESSLE